MQPLVTTICGFGVIGIFMLILAEFKAPEGIEDEEGFHFLAASDQERYLASARALSAGDVLFFK